MATRPTPRPRTIGGAATLISAGVLDDLDANRDVRGDLWYGRPGVLGIGPKMERDPHVRASLEAYKAPLAHAVFGFDAASQDPLDVEIADFCAWALFEVLPWTRNVRQILNYLRDGFSLFEATDDVRTVPAARFPLHPGRGQGVVYTGWHYRPAWSVRRFRQREDDPTQVRLVEQFLRGNDAETAGFVEIPGDRLIRFTEDQEGADFTGFASLRSAFGPWNVKQTLILLDTIRHEKQSLGVPSLTLPEDATDDEVDVAEEMLTDLRAHEKGFFVLPAGWEFSWNAVDLDSGTNILDSIHKQDLDIAHNMGVGFMLLGVQDRTGSFALANTQAGQYTLRLEKHSQFICDVINRGSDGWSPVRRIVEMNYGTEAAQTRTPTCAIRMMPHADYSKILPIVSNLQSAGLWFHEPQDDTFFRAALKTRPRTKPPTAEEIAAAQPTASDPGPEDTDDGDSDPSEE